MSNFSEVDLYQIGLIKQFQETESNKIFNYFMKEYSSFIYRIAVRYVTPKVQIDDLMSEGNIGLLKALRGYDPDRGYKFVTYLVRWVKYYIWDFHQTNRRIGVSANIRRVNRTVKYLKEKGISTTIYTVSEEEVKEYATELKVSPEVIYDAIFLMNTNEVSLTRSAETINDFTVDVADDAPNPEEILLANTRDTRIKELVKYGMDRLDDRQRYILQKRCLNESECTLRVISEELGVTRERVRQLEGVAKDKISRAVSPYIANVL